MSAGVRALAAYAKRRPSGEKAFASMKCWTSGSSVSRSGQPPGRSAYSWWNSSPSSSAANRIRPSCARTATARTAFEVNPVSWSGQPPSTRALQRLNWPEMLLEKRTLSPSGVKASAGWKRRNAKNCSNGGSRPTPPTLTESGQLVGIGDEVDRGDSAARDREADHGDRPATRHDDHARAAVDDRRPGEPSERGAARQHLACDLRGSGDHGWNARA